MSVATCSSAKFMLKLVQVAQGARESQSKLGLLAEGDSCLPSTLSGHIKREGATLIILVNTELDIISYRYIRESAATPCDHDLG